MGLFSKLGDLGRNGPAERIVCKTCDSTYSGNIDRGFAYAICGGCLEREGNRAKNNGDNPMYQQIQMEFRRRGSNWS
jgi:hypothetical protein